MSSMWLAGLNQAFSLLSVSPLLSALSLSICSLTSVYVRLCCVECMCVMGVVDGVLLPDEVVRSREDRVAGVFYPFNA